MDAYATKDDVPCKADGVLPTVSAGQVCLVSGDGVPFVVSARVMRKSRLIRGMLDDLGECPETIPLPNVGAAALKKVVQWCEHHQNDRRPPKQATSRAVEVAMKVGRIEQAKLDGQGDGAADARGIDEADTVSRGDSSEQGRAQEIPEEETSEDDDDDDPTKKSWLREIEISDWDSKFIQLGSDELLFQVMNAANYLDIRGLLDIGVQTVANAMKGRTTEEIRQRFNIVNDFTPEEEEQIRRELELVE